MTNFNNEDNLVEAIQGYCLFIFGAPIIWYYFFLSILDII